MKKSEVLAGYAIVVIDRGFVYVGNVRVEGEWCIIRDALNIRRYGTTAGLGELALKGPQESTVLDEVGVVRAPMRAVISLIETEAAKWSLSS